MTLSGLLSLFAEHLKLACQAMGQGASYLPTAHLLLKALLERPEAREALLLQNVFDFLVRLCLEVESSASAAAEDDFLQEQVVGVVRISIEGAVQPFLKVKPRLASTSKHGRREQLFTLAERNAFCDEYQRIELGLQVFGASLTKARIAVACSSLGASPLVKLIIQQTASAS